MAQSMEQQEQVVEKQKPREKKKEKKKAKEKLRGARSDRLLHIDYECLSDSEKAQHTTQAIEERIYATMRYHRGKEESISPVSLFESVYGISPWSMDTYTRAYWWNIIKVILRKMRREGRLFVINQGQMLFVLKSEIELGAYKAKIDRDIDNLRRSKANAERWVRQKKWKYL